MDAKRIGSTVKKAIRSKRGERILDHYGLNLWTEGACWPLAHAIKRRFGGELLAIVDPNKSPPYHLQAEHVVVAIGKYLIDGDGASTVNQMLDRWAKMLQADPDIIRLEDSNHLEIECDTEAISYIYKILSEIK